MMYAPPAQPADDTPVPFPLLRTAATLLATVLVPGGLLTVGLELLGQSVHAQVNILAVGICFAGCFIGLLPVWLLSKQHRHGAAQGFMAGMLLRIVVCAAGYFALQYGGYPHTQILLYYLAGWYLATLMVEVKLVSSFLLAHAVAPSLQTDAPAEPAPEADPESHATAPGTPPGPGRVGLEGDV